METVCELDEELYHEHLDKFIFILVMVMDGHHLNIMKIRKKGFLKEKYCYVKRILHMLLYWIMLILLGKKLPDGLLIN